MDHLFIDTIRIYAPPTLNTYGQKVDSGTYTSVRGRFLDKVSVTRGNNGEQIKSDAQCWLSVNNTVANGQHLTVVGSTTRYEVMEVYKPKDSVGPHHIKLLLRRIHDGL